MMRWCDEDELPHDTGNHCVHAVQDERGDKWVYRLGGFGLHGEWHADVLRRKWRTRCDGDMIPSLEESDEDLHRLGEWEEVETSGDGPGSMRQMGSCVLYRRYIFVVAWHPEDSVGWQSTADRCAVFDTAQLRWHMLQLEGDSFPAVFSCLVAPESESTCIGYGGMTSDYASDNPERPTVPVRFALEREGEPTEDGEVVLRARCQRLRPTNPDAGPGRVFFHCVAMYNDTFYVLGGNENGSYDSTSDYQHGLWGFKLSPDSCLGLGGSDACDGTWVDLSKRVQPPRGSNHIMFPFNGGLIVIGGYDGEEHRELNEVWFFDIDAAEWIRASEGLVGGEPMPPAWGHAGCMCPDGSIFVAGGEGGWSGVRQVYRYAKRLMVVPFTPATRTHFPAAVVACLRAWMTLPYCDEVSCGVQWMPREILFYIFMIMCESVGPLKWPKYDAYRIHGTVDAGV